MPHCSFLETLNLDLGFHSKRKTRVDQDLIFDKTFFQN